MNYKKPEVVKLDNAVKAIQGGNKGTNTAPDSDIHKPFTVTAYEADE